MEKTLNVKLLSHTMNPELLIATAGKLCYSPSDIQTLVEKQTPEMIDKFVNMLISMGHESPLEHVNFSFAIEGVSRSLTHQLVRHRIASYSQQSQRYVNLDKSFSYVIPKKIKDNSGAKVLFEDAMKAAFEYYVLISRELLIQFMNEFYEEEYGGTADIEEIEKIMIQNHKKKYNAFTKMAIENARAVLPNACETKIICTMNLRTLVNFCHHRCCKRAQDEINELAWAMIAEVKKVSPLLAENLGASCQFGNCPEGSMCCGQPYPKKK